jgi:hypothetical protein
MIIIQNFMIPHRVVQVFHSSHSELLILRDHLQWHVLPTEFHKKYICLKKVIGGGGHRLNGDLISLNFLFKERWLKVEFLLLTFSILSVMVKLMFNLSFVHTVNTSFCIFEHLLHSHTCSYCTCCSVCISLYVVFFSVFACDWLLCCKCAFMILLLWFILSVSSRLFSS